MRKRTARVLWLVVGGIVLGLLAIGATSYVMRLDEESQDRQGGLMDRPLEPVDQDDRVVTEQALRRSSGRSADVQS